MATKAEDRIEAGRQLILKRHKEGDQWYFAVEPGTLEDTVVSDLARLFPEYKKEEILLLLALYVARLAENELHLGVDFSDEEREYPLLEFEAKLERLEMGELLVATSFGQ